MLSVAVVVLLITSCSDAAGRFEALESAHDKMSLLWDTTPFAARDEIDEVCTAVESARYDSMPSSDQRWLALAGESLALACKEYQSALDEIDWLEAEAARRDNLAGRPAGIGRLNSAWRLRTSGAQAAVLRACGYLRDYDVAAQDGQHFVVCLR